MLSQPKTAVGKTIRTNHDKENPYFMVARATAQDKRISYEALGVLTYLLSQSDQWEVRVGELAQRGKGEKKQGLTRIYRILKELRAAGYVVLEAEYVKGKIVNWTYQVHERPIDLLNQNLQVEKLNVENDSPNKDKEVPESTKDKNLSVANNATGSGSILDTDSKENPNPPATKPNTQDPLQSSAKVSPAKPPREQDPIYNAVAEHIFGITDAETLKLMQEKESAATRIGIIVSWLNGKTDSIAYGKTKKFVGKINGTPTPEHVKTFAAWYARKNSTAAMIRDGEKFVEYWRQWASTAKKTSTPRPTAPAQPAVMYTPEQIEKRQRDLAAMRQGVKP